uniref:Uncharacterized protein n=1 Tax=Tanacetum cinerariifolium TaxID=118510 RepID=A0A699GRK0_TANCI|nr:hypothetical protein [Tanacetum cinerariifolium]
MSFVQIASWDWGEECGKCECDRKDRVRKSGGRLLGKMHSKISLAGNSVLRISKLLQTNSLESSQMFEERAKKYQALKHPDSIF